MSIADQNNRDYPQTLKESYDPSLQRLRVDALINDGVDALVINPDGSINVNVSSLPLPVSVTAIGTIGATAPATAIELGAVDSNGKLQNLTVDPSGKLLVDITGSSTITGTVSSNLLGLNSFQTSQYTVGTAAVQLTVTPLTNRSSMSIKVKTTTSNDMVYISSTSGVTTSNGYILFNGDSIQLDLTPAHQIWAIGTSSGQSVYVLEIGI